MTRIRSYLALATALVAGQAFAAPGPFGGGMLTDTMHNLLGPVAQYDLNGDGQVTPNELDAAKAKMVDLLMSQFLSRFDADDNGIVTAGEAAAVFEPAAEEWVARLIARFDANGDGSLSGSELPVWSPLRAYDTNDDDIVSSQELIDAAKARVDAQVAQLISQYDADDDGAISDAELETAFGARADRVISSLLARFDLNDDGTITREEVASVIRRMPRFRHGGRMGM